MILKLTNVTKKFGNLTAVDNVSFELKKGERIGLIGGNGAGKTTISEMIVGIIKPTSGIIEYGFKYEDSPKEKVGMQFQQADYPSGLTVKDIITFARNLRKLKDMNNDDLKDLLEVFQMDDFYNRKAKSLSGGQRQKLNILLSIIHKPEIVILDELSTGLDIAAREDIIAFTDNLLKKRNISTILISHHMAEIKSLCDKVIVLDRGKVVLIDTIKNIEKKYGSLDDYMKSMIKEQTKIIKSTPLEVAKKELSKAEKAYRKNKTNENKDIVHKLKVQIRHLVKEEKHKLKDKNKEQKILGKRTAADFKQKQIEHTQQLKLKKAEVKKGGKK